MNSVNDQVNIPIEMGTPINQIKTNRQINVNNLVKNVETNIENLERTRNMETESANFRVGGYQYEHQQLMNQANNPIIENIAPVQNPNIQQIPNNFNQNNTHSASRPVAIMDDTEYTKENSWFTFLNRELFLIILLFSLFSHRKFNTLLLRFIPFIADSRFYTIFIIFKGILFSLILSFFRKI
tara:strand:+ start:970 stop:1518 length:549 start_codon:yes stop_codon:yes gene_type:complete